MNVPRLKYQVFISSTYEDLRDERLAVNWSIMKLGHIPAGMEAFTAKNDRGWETIKNAIDESDYYVLIIAGRYGAIDEEWGMSWTEHEYEYAYGKGLPVLAFIRDQSAITADKIDNAQESQAALHHFIDKVKDRHHINKWKTRDELKSEVSLALSSQMNEDRQFHKTRLGWVRGANAISNEPQYTEVWKTLRDSDVTRQMLGASRHGDTWYFICINFQSFMPWRDQIRDALCQGVTMYIAYINLEETHSAGFSADIYAKAMCPYPEGVDGAIKSSRATLNELTGVINEAEVLAGHTPDCKIYKSLYPHPFLGFLCRSLPGTDHKGWGIISPYLFFTSPNLSDNYGTLFYEGSSLFERYQNCFVRYFEHLEQNQK